MTWVFVVVVEEDLGLRADDIRQILGGERTKVHEIDAIESTTRHEVTHYEDRVAYVTRTRRRLEKET